jgi:beta-mannosidase
MLGEWSGASVESDGERPDPDVWTPLDGLGRPPAFSGADAVAYRTEFDDPRSPEDERAVLELRGLYAHARVWLNGDLLGEHDAYFRPFRTTFEPAETNELVVECRAPADRFGGIHDTDAVPEADATPGIWWGADLETLPGTAIVDLDATPHLVDDEAKIDVRAVVETDESLDDRITFSLRPEGEFQSRGMMDRAAVEADAGERAVVEHTIDVRDPSLWWPAALGPQHRYTVRAKLGDHTRQITTGLRSITRDDDGLLVNGERLRARGFVLDSATTADVDRALEANANLVRMHAHAPPQAVYEACSEAGLLVWQDLPLTGPGTFDADRGTDLANTLVATYGHHPCLAAAGVVSDPVDPFPDTLGSGTFDRLRLRWRAWRTGYDHGPAETVADAFPADLPVFPVAGPLGCTPDAAHLYPGWDYGDAADIEWLCDRYDLDDVVGAFGAAAFGAAEPEEFAGFDREKHDDRVPDADDPAASQRYQARVTKCVAEALRRRRATVLAVDSLRDTGDAGTGVLERDGSEKTAYEAVAAAFEPVQATLTDPTAGASTPVTVVNDTAGRVSGAVTVETGDDALTDDPLDVTVDPHETATAGDVSVPADAASVTLSFTTDDRTVTNRYYM